MKTLNEVLMLYEKKGFMFVPGMNACMKRAIRSRNDPAKHLFREFEMYCMEAMRLHHSDKTQLAMMVRRRWPQRNMRMGSPLSPPVSHEVIEVPELYLDRNKKIMTVEAVSLITESFVMMATVMHMEEA